MKMNRAPCPRCGATTTVTAELICRLSPIGDTGDYECPGDDEDSEGFILQPTPEEISEMRAQALRHFAEALIIERRMLQIDPGCFGEDADIERYRATYLRARDEISREDTAPCPTCGRVGEPACSTIGCQKGDER